MVYIFQSGHTPIYCFMRNETRRCHRRLTMDQHGITCAD